LIVVQKFQKVLNEVFSIKKEVKLVVVCKNQTLSSIFPIIKTGHIHFGENRVQEAKIKWYDIKKGKNIKLHLIGKLQSNKSKEAVEIFDFIHSLDNFKLAKSLSDHQKLKGKSLKYFIQVNISGEVQKSGISPDNLTEFVNTCRSNLDLDIIGLMCIPPINEDPTNNFKILADLAKKNNLQELSMGMSNDYLKALSCGATYIRLGSAVFN